MFPAERLRYNRKQFEKGECGTMLYPRENEVRAVMDLSGIWNFELGDAGEPGETCGSLKAPELISVPASYNDQKEDPAYRNHYGWV